MNQRKVQHCVANEPLRIFQQRISIAADMPDEIKENRDTAGCGVEIVGMPALIMLLDLNTCSRYLRQCHEWAISHINSHAALEHALEWNKLF